MEERGGGRWIREVEGKEEEKGAEEGKSWGGK